MNNRQLGVILLGEQLACDRRLGALLSASATSCGARPPLRGVVLVASPDSGNLCLSDSMRLRVASRASCSKRARLWLRSQADKCNRDITDRLARLHTSSSKSKSSALRG